MRSDGTSNEVSFEPRSGGGIAVVDPIERRRYPIETDGPVDVRPADDDVFRFPVDVAGRLETDAIELPSVVATYVRDGDGRVCQELQQNARATFPEGEYTLECCTPIKLYLRVESGLDVTATNDAVTVRFPGDGPVFLGARSRHERPAATVTVTEDPVDHLAAISTFGSALKTTSPERSFPTLRGHPPEIELGADRSIPDGLVPPAEDCWIETPAAFEYVYPMAPLAYYLGVPVREGPVPRIVGSQFQYDLAQDFPASVERTLGQIFLLECVTRTEGYYPIDLAERAAIESVVDLDFESLYDAPQPDRLDAYLSVPYEAVAGQVPEWPSGAVLAPEPESATTLPFLVDDLAFVRTGTSERVDPGDVENGHLHGLCRGAKSAVDQPYVRTTTSTAARQDTWVGDGMPVDASKAVTEAYRNRVGRTPDDGDIEIVVVCNDAEMGSERDAADEVYGSREDLEFDVTVRRDLTAAELRTVLGREYDLLHYVGHIESAGFCCSDGHLDVASVDDVGIDAFVLNACRSFGQGVDLLESGAIGGIVTLSDVVNLGAVRIGKTVATLLNGGFPLHAALDVARDKSVIGPEYAVVGDGGLQVTQADVGVPTLARVSSTDSASCRLQYVTYTPGNPGAMYYPLVGDGDHHYLAPGETGPFDVEVDELADLFDGSEVPVEYAGAVYSVPTFLDVAF